MDTTPSTRPLAHLNRQVINTKDAVDGINNLLMDSGFQGFSIREKLSVPNSYEVVHQDGCIAQNLSEGECNFIAFLYFYHLVSGSDSEDDTMKDKIVVIDDPVSSMDSSALFIVSANPDTPAYKTNYNPVQNAYAALWGEYKQVTSSTTILNVIRRILEHYFLQLCRYDGQDLVKRVLHDNRDKFICQITDDCHDCSQYHLASAMLSYLGAHSNNISDGLNFVEDCTDVEQYRETFKMIFELMGQGQHYDMMMGLKVVSRI